MDAKHLKEISKNLSYVLRHRPDSVGIDLSPAGWVNVNKLLQALKNAGRVVTLDLLRTVVAQNDKQRFEFSKDGAQIRARQGHSTEVDLGYEPAIPPPVLYHGTATQNLDSIMREGLIKGRRHHVHMSVDKQTMLQVGMRHGKPVLLKIDAAGMHADRHEFFVTGNHVWLTDHVPVKYLSETA